jgi:ribosomal protein L7/L12
MSSARLDNPEVLALKDQRKPATAVKLLRERTGLDLGDAKRLVDRLP